MSKLITNTIRHTGASSDAITLASDGTATAKITNVAPGNRNIIINGACNVAQRGTSTTTSGAYCVDRFNVFHGGTDEAPTFAQVDVTSNDSGPWEKGFSKALRVTNGNQTGGAGAADYVWLQYKLEAQDLAHSGWNYTSGSSYITFSFWVKSSVAQEFKGWLQSVDGTAQNYPFTTGSLSADTWTKITKTIPGHADLQFDSNAESGLVIHLTPFFGTDYTNDSVTEDAWQAYGSGTRAEDSTSTWYTTNDAQFETTGWQLEVGSYATEFEHRTYHDELQRCYRYYQRFDGGAANNSFGVGNVDGSSQCQIHIQLHTKMRTNVSSMDTTGSAGDYKVRVRSTQNCDAIPVLAVGGQDGCFTEWHANSHGFGDDESVFAISGSTSSYLGFSAEI